MATKPVEVTLEKVSHYVELMPYAPHAVAKEELWLTMFSEWRGERVRIEATLERATYREGVHPWRFSNFAPRTWCEATTYTNAGWYGDLTDTARSRLYSAALPVAVAYGDSEDYARTYAAAIVRAIREQYRERYEAARTIRAMVTSWRDIIGSDAASKLETLAANLAAVAATVEDLSDEGSNAATYEAAS